MDAGAVLGQSCVEIGQAETAGELHDRLALDGADLLARVLAEIQAGKAVERAQDDSKASIAPKLSRDSTRIDWNQPGASIANLICGMSPWPGCRTRLKDNRGQELMRLTLLRARLRESSAIHQEFGTILPDGGIAAEGSIVDILQLQPEGKRPMAFGDFRNGHVWPAGAIIESIL